MGPSTLYHLASESELATPGLISQAMVVRARRVVEVSAPPERVWEFIDDPEKRAEPISIVEDFELLQDGKAVWHVSLPIPITDRTMRVETENRRRIPTEEVEFVGNSRAFRVIGKHVLRPTENGTELDNSFTVDGRIPGVERFFKKNIDSELENLEFALKEYLATETP